MIDFHCDTVEKLWSSNSPETLLSNSCSVDVDKMKAGGSTAQCFALFVPTGEHVPPAHEGMGPAAILHALHDRFITEMNTCAPFMRQARTAADIRRNKREGFLSAILTVEEGEALEGRIETLDELDSWGVRICSLVWNNENSLAYPNHPEQSIMDLPLKAKGREAVEKMNSLGMLVDVSHLNDGGFADVAATCGKNTPFIATHSNARSITNVCRNLTDSQLHTIAEHGGLAGLNFCGAFLLPTASGAPISRGPMGAESRIEDMVRHTLHIYKIAGRQSLALGTDFDGIGGKLEVSSLAGMPRLRDALAKAGLSQSVLDDMWENNALRILER